MSGEKVQKDLVEGWNNPQAYRDALVPKSAEQSDANWTAFVDELYALRNKYGIADIHLVAEHRLVYPDGEEGVVFGNVHFGDSSHAERMVAWAMGMVTSERQERIAKIIADTPGVRKQRNRE